MPLIWGILMSVMTRSMASFSRISMGLDAGGGGLDPVAFLLEDDGQEVEQALFVVDDEYVFHGQILRAGSFLRLHGQLDEDLGPFVALGADVDPSPRSRPRCAGRRPCRGRGRSRSPSRRARRCGPCPRPSCRRPCRRSGSSGRPSPSCEVDGQGPAAGHGLEGVLGQVPEDLLELVRAGDEPRLRPGVIPVQADIRR